MKTFIGDNTGSVDVSLQLAEFLTNGGGYVDKGLYLVSNVNVQFAQFRLLCHPQAMFVADGPTPAMFSITDCISYIDSIQISGNGTATVGMYFNGGDARIGRAEVYGIGDPTNVATNLVAGIRFSNMDYVHVDNCTFKDINAVGDETIGNGIGAARGLYFDNCKPYFVNNFYMEGGSAEELDYFQVNLGCEGGVINNLVARYNENVKRCVKVQSGHNVIKHADIRPMSTFASISVDTDVGEKNLNCIDYAADTEGSLRIEGGYIDATGFQVAISNSASTKATVHVSNTTLKGSNKNNQHNWYTTGFFLGAQDSGSSMTNCVIKGFTRQFVSVGNTARIENNEFIDPPKIVGQFGDINPSYGHRFNGNRVITKTDGWCNESYVVSVNNVNGIVVHDNHFIADGNQKHTGKFLSVLHQDAVVREKDNYVPQGMDDVAY